MTQLSAYTDAGATEQTQDQDRIQGHIGRGFLSLAEWVKRHPGWVILTVVAAA
jgi:hypothetical protein